MDPITFDELKATKVSELRDMAVALKTMIEPLEWSEEDLSRLPDEIENAAEGKAAKSAYRNARNRLLKLRPASTASQKIGDTLEEYATKLAAAKKAIKSVEGEIESMSPYLYMEGSKVQVNKEALETVPLIPFEDAIYSIQESAEERIRNALNSAGDADSDAKKSLASLTPDEIVTAEEGAPPPTPGLDDEVKDLEDMPPDEAAEAWDDMTAEEQAWAIANYPEIVGAVDGVPCEVRDQANRIVLDDQIEDVQKDLSDSTDSDEIALLEDKLAGLELIDERINDSGQPRAYLLGIDSEGDGKAIVSIGNPDEADNTGVYVPGTGSTLGAQDGSLESNLDRADTMYADSAKLSGGSTATVMWLGYDAPSITEAPSEERAVDGAPALNDFLHGLDANNPKSHTTVVGHSYGSTVAGYALRDYDPPIDDLVVVGSPGLGVDSIDELNIDPDHVWAVKDIADPIGHSGDSIYPFGEDPWDYANQIPSETDKSGLDAHSAYWDEDNPSKEGISQVITGQYDDVPIDD